MRVIQEPRIKKLIPKYFVCVSSQPLTLEETVRWHGAPGSRPTIVVHFCNLELDLNWPCTYTSSWIQFGLRSGAALDGVCIHCFKTYLGEG